MRITVLYFSHEDYYECDEKCAICPLRWDCYLHPWTRWGDESKITISPTDKEKTLVLQAEIDGRLTLTGSCSDDYSGL